MPKAPGWTEIACPMCKEPISAEALRCPRCQADFTPEQVVARKKEQQGKVKVGCFSALALVLFVGWCSMGDDKPYVPENPGPTAKADAIKVYRDVMAAVTPCDQAGLTVGDRMQKGDPITAYRAAEVAEATCLGVRSTIEKIKVPTSLGAVQHQKMTEALQTCQTAYVSKWDMAKRVKNGLNGDTNVAAMAGLQSAMEDAKAQVMSCTVQMIGSAIALGVTPQELGITADSAAAAR